MGPCPAILTIFPGVLTISTEPPSPPSFSWPQLCALGCGPEVCGQGSLALLSSGPVSLLRGWREESVWGRRGLDSQVPRDQEELQNQACSPHNLSASPGPSASTV